MSKSVQLFLTLFLILSAQDISETTPDPIFISKLENYNSTARPATGGVLGGNKLVVTGYGFDLIA